MFPLVIVKDRMMPTPPCALCKGKEKNEVGHLLLSVIENKEHKHKHCCAFIMARKHSLLG